eukprot:scaffold9459_cov113-Amphora_coffeaeformis.AAC.1
MQFVMTVLETNDGPQALAIVRGQANGTVFVVTRLYNCIVLRAPMESRLISGEMTMEAHNCDALTGLAENNNRIVWRTSVQ